MGKVSAIEWTDATFNGWIGCEEIAPECVNCYARKLVARMKNGASLWQGARRRTSERYWKQPLEWARTLPAEFGRRPRVFCHSLADVFDKVVGPAWRGDLFKLIAATPELDWLLLTKRIGNAPRMLAEIGVTQLPQNVWLGVTAGTRRALERDVPKLAQIPATIHFVSAEPLLEELLDLDAYLPLIDWLIIGGESGPKARTFTLGHGKTAVRAARAANVAVLVKQLGAKPVNREGERCPFITHKKGANMDEWPEELRVREFPKAA